MKANYHIQMEIKEFDILKFLKKNPGSSATEIARHFKRGRTTLLYQLEILLGKGLIIKRDEERKNLYFLSDLKKVESYYSKQLEMLKTEINSLKSFAVSKPQKGKELKLAFVNYIDLSEDMRPILQKYYDIIDYSDKELFINPEVFAYRAKDADVVVNNWACDVDKNLIDLLPKLKYLHANTTMTSYVDINYLNEKGIHLSNIPDGYRSIALEEYALAQTFALLRNVAIASNQFKSGVHEFVQFKGENLRGKVIGVVGTSGLAMRFISMVKNLGVEVLVYSENSNAKPEDFGVSKFTPINEFVAKVDIFYWLASNDSDHEIQYRLNKKMLSLFKSPKYIVSISKFRDIDYGLIRDLIDKGMIKGIALDSIFVDEEKDSNYGKIMYLPNVLITPDVSWYTSTSISNSNKHLLDRLVAYARGDLTYMINNPK